MLENAAWSYEDADPQVPELKGRVAFYSDKLDAWYEDGVRVTPEREPADAGGQSNPLAHWIISEAWDAATSRELTARFVRRLNEFGMAITASMWLFIHCIRCRWQRLIAGGRARR